MVAVIGTISLQTAPAHAGTTFGEFTVVFTGTLTIGEELLVPAAPGNNVQCSPLGFCPQRTTSFSFDTNAPGVSACLGAMATHAQWEEYGVGLSVNGGGVAGNCSVVLGGTITGPLTGDGAWCGLSRGLGGATISVTPVTSPAWDNSVSTGVNWLVSAGTLLPLIFGSPDVVGVGFAMMTNPAPGPCGVLFPMGNHHGATSFQLTGFAAVTVADVD